MKTKRLLFSMAAFLLIATMFSSCGATYTASGTNVSKIDELAFIEPRSLIYYFSPESGYLDSGRLFTISRQNLATSTHRWLLVLNS